MNIMDLGIVAIIFISILVGMYYGFSVSLLSIASFFLSWILSLIFHPALTKVIVYNHPNLLEKVVYYSEGSSKVPFEDKILAVEGLAPEKIDEIIKISDLPSPFANSVKNNLTKGSLPGLENVEQYFDYTVANLILNLASFIILFLIIYLILRVLISMKKYISYLPVLTKYDYLTSGFLGFFRGILFLYVIFAFVPLIYLVVPADFLEKFFGSSKLAGLFIKGNLFSSFVKGVL